MFRKNRDTQSKTAQLIPSIYKISEKTHKVAVIGAGWFGVHTAIELSKSGYLVTIYEKNPTIFSGTSGTFGVRIHSGPHYPRSLSTRKACRDGFHEIQTTYPEMCNKHLHAIYAHGKIDADGNSSKIKESLFKPVCKEFQYRGELSLEDSPFNASELLAAYDINEPSAVLGERLRKFFEQKLHLAEVTVQCGVSITEVKKHEEGIVVGHTNGSDKFDAVVDATGFQQNFLPFKKPLPVKMNVFYQPCLALVYRDRFPKEKPISFIVMDGWFPCLMPYDDRLTTEKPIEKYIMTHGKWTILGSYEDSKKAHQAFSVVDDQFVQENIKSLCESDMQRFWPKFLERFEYIGWKGSVLAKMKTEKEFRGSIVFQEPTVGMISIFPGKITNIFESAREAQTLIAEQLLVEKPNVQESKEGYRYIKGGVLDTAKIEIMAPIVTDERNTCSLNTFQNKLFSMQKSKLEDKGEKASLNHSVSTLSSLNRIENIYRIIALGGFCGGAKKVYDKDTSLLFMFGVIALLAGASYFFKQNATGGSVFDFSMFKKSTKPKALQELPNKSSSSSIYRSTFKISQGS